MPTSSWQTPSLKDVRKMVRDNVTALIAGAAIVPNNVLRVMADSMAGLAHLTLEYISWLARMLMPDLAETEWLDRHGAIWLNNSDGSIGRKFPSLAQGTVNFTGIEGSVIPAGTVLNGPAVGILGLGGVQYEVLAMVIIGAAASPGEIRALDGGPAGNLAPDDVVSLVDPPEGVDATAIVVQVDGGAEEENDDDLRTRVLLRIQEPPMGGDATDYIQWALRVPGVTRAWSYPNEMGIGTVTVRFMMDQLRVDDDGFPNIVDVETVRNYLDTVRPVAIKDFFVVAPLRFPVDMVISNLVTDNEATRGAITANLKKLFLLRTKPGQTWYREWASEGITNAAGVKHFDLILTDKIMAGNGYMPVLGTVTYG